MPRTFSLIATVILLTATVGIASWFYADDRQSSKADDAAAVPAEARPGAQSASAEQRIASLEQALREERAARRILQEQVAALAESVGDFVAPFDEDDGAPPDSQSASQGPASASEMEEMLESLRDRVPANDSDEQRVSRLLAAGFDPQTAEWIVQRESELQMESLRLRHESRRTGKPISADAARSGEDMLRSDLGDADYERYLEATGRPTSVRIDNVLASSPAETAGLRVGDRIVRYDGERVFDMGDLSRMTLAGEPGRSVSLTVLRDGKETQFSLPRGPIGVQGGASHGHRRRPR